MTWTFETLKNALASMVEVNHVAFTKAFMTVELDIKNQSILDQLYRDYMENDDWALISEELSTQASLYQDQLTEDLTDIFEKLYRTGEGSSFIMDVLTTRHLIDTMGNYEFLDPDDYASSSLEELERLIQEELPVNSSDYFGDLTYLAVTKEMLDQKSTFLQHYVASLLETNGSVDKQPTWVLE